jgi:hypothetical protein
MHKFKVKIMDDLCEKQVKLEDTKKWSKSIK